MRFVIVSDRAPRAYSACARCAKPIVEVYLRELTSNSTYCDYACYAGYDRVLTPWSFAGFDNFALVTWHWQLAKDFQRVLVDAYTN
jgi:hypothetical protein